MVDSNGTTTDIFENNSTRNWHKLSLTLSYEGMVIHELPPKWLELHIKN